IRGGATPPPAPRAAAPVPPPPQTARPAVPRSTPSAEVPVLRDESSDDMVVLVGPVRRFLGSRLGLATIGGLVLVVGAISMIAASGDDEGVATNDEVALAGAATPEDAISDASEDE